MRKELENMIIEKMKQGYYPIYVGEEGFIVITMKAYLAAAEYADAEVPHFWYGDVCFDLLDVVNRSEEIEAEDFDFMPRKIEEDFEDISEVKKE